jgi:hypothetical protein
MPRYLMLVEAGAPLDEWVAQGVAVGVIQAHAGLQSRTRVLRDGGIPLAVEASNNAPHDVILFEAQDGPSALVFAATCPGRAALSLFKVDANSNWSTAAPP